MDRIQTLYALDPSLPATHAAHSEWTAVGRPLSPCHPNPHRHRASALPALPTAPRFISAPRTKRTMEGNGSPICPPTTTAPRFLLLFHLYPAVHLWAPEHDQKSAATCVSSVLTSDRWCPPEHHYGGVFLLSTIRSEWIWYLETDWYGFVLLESNGQSCLFDFNMIRAPGF